MTVGLLSFASVGLNINLLFQANALAAPQAFRDAIQTAANMIQAACPNTPATVYISVEYGTLNGSALPSGTGASSRGFSPVSYTNLKAAIAANIKTTTMQTLFNSMGSGSSYGGVTTWAVTPACEKALGLIDPRLNAQDGASGFATDIPAGNLIGVALHEIRQAMGGVRGAGTVQDLSTFTSAGTITVNDTATAYFSVDGGVTNLANWSGTSDTSDFLNGGAHEVLNGFDPFDASYTANSQQRLTTLDIINLNALGFQ